MHLLKHKGFHKKTWSCLITTESYLRYAHGIVSEYLTEDLSVKLLKYLGLPEEKLSECHGKRKLSVAQCGGNSNTAVPHSAPTGELFKKARQEDLANGGVLDLTKPEKVGFFLNNSMSRLGFGCTYPLPYLHIDSKDV